MPLFCDLYVGGKRLNSAKLIVYPASCWPSTVIEKKLETSLAPLVGLKSRDTDVQSREGGTATFLLANTVPVEETKETVNVVGPDGWGEGKRTLNEAL